MSKTDKTRPEWVKALDRKGFLEEYHDHRDGTCDLPEVPQVWRRGTGMPRTACHWWPSTEFYCDRANTCGCPLCTMQLQRKAERRRDRRSARRYAAGGWEQEG